MKWLRGAFAKGALRGSANLFLRIVTAVGNPYPPTAYCAGDVGRAILRLMSGAMRLTSMMAPC
jgi:hypothetical protein